MSSVIATAAAGNILACYNPGCSNAHKLKFRAPLKCANCKTARYCDKTCQRAHWKVHKEFCNNWAETAKRNSASSLIDVKKKMSHFLWLIRGLPDYVKELLDEYVEAKRDGFKGCVEFYFETFQDLFDAIALIETLPVHEEKMYYPMPYAPTFQKRSDGLGPVGKKVKMRWIFTEHEKEFMKKVHDKKILTIDHSRENMNKLLATIVKDSEEMFLLSCAVKLEGTFATHSYDFIYKDLNGWSKDLIEEFESCTRSRT